MLAVSEVVNERLVVLWLASVVRLHFNLYSVALQVVCIELLMDSEVVVDLIQLKPLFGRDKNLSFLVLVGNLHKLLFQNLLRVLWPFQIVQLTYYFISDLLLFLNALFC